MTARRLFAQSSAVATLALAFVMPLAASAAEIEPFTPAAFDAAKAAGKPILIDVSAPWCPTCKAQHPILSNLEAQPKFKDLVVLDVDFDSQKDVLRRLGRADAEHADRLQGRSRDGALDRRNPARPYRGAARQRFLSAPR